MHELSLSLNILDLVERSVGPGSGKQVHEVRISVGKLSGVEATILEEALRMVSAHTAFASTVWVMTQKPAAGLCSSCGMNFPMEYLWDVCPACGGRALKITEGDDLEVDSIIISE